MLPLLSTLLNGLSLGSVYAIIALGYTMVYGIAKMLNFAHGDVIMIGAYISFSAIFYWGLHPILGFLLAMVVCTVLGILIGVTAVIALITTVSGVSGSLSSSFSFPP